MKLVNKNQKNRLKSVVYTTLISMMIFSTQVLTVFADVESRVNKAAETIQGVLSGLLVVVGICVCLFKIIVYLPSSDNPHEKDLVWKSIGRIMGLVAFGAACVWVFPWVYGLFQK